MKTPEERAEDVLRKLTPFALQGCDDAWNELQDGMERAIREAVDEAVAAAAPRWIRVQQDRPTEGEQVLMCVDTGGLRRWVRWLGTYTQGRFWVSYIGKDVIVDPSHWMRIPPDPAS